MELSILDIAKRAGVSKSTVSRVINGGSASPKTRELIERTMQEMGYYPNYMARGLRGVHNTVVGILSLGRGMFTNPAISRRVAGILDTLSENGCDLLIVQDSNPMRRRVIRPNMCVICASSVFRGSSPLGGMICRRCSRPPISSAMWCTAVSGCTQTAGSASTTAITITAAICTVFL